MGRDQGAAAWNLQHHIRGSTLRYHLPMFCLCGGEHNLRLGGEIRHSMARAGGCVSYGEIDFPAFEDFLVAIPVARNFSTKPSVFAHLGTD